MCRSFLTRGVVLASQVQNPASSTSYLKSLDAAAKRALYDNLGGFEQLALWVDAAVVGSRQDDWRNNRVKIKMVSNAIAGVLKMVGWARRMSLFSP